jgi:predicted metal-dependent hydrolase
MDPVLFGVEFGGNCHRLSALSKPFARLSAGVVSRERGQGMATYRLAAAPAVEVHLKRTARARRLSLRVSSLDGRVTLTLPPHVPERVARAFAEEKARWIREAVGRIAGPVEVAPGAELPVEGAPLRLVAGPGRAAQRDGDALLVPEGRAGIAAEAWLKHLARARLVAAVDRHAARLGRKPGRITLRDPRSRWGSCSAQGNLMFSWRLAMAPASVLDYVAAHEVAHLAHMDHSPAFWRAVERLFPDHAAERCWLRREGSALHRYRFRAD